MHMHPGMHVHMRGGAHLVMRMRVHMRVHAHLDKDGHELRVERVGDELREQARLAARRPAGEEHGRGLAERRAPRAEVLGDGLEVAAIDEHVVMEREGAAHAERRPLARREARYAR